MIVSLAAEGIRLTNVTDIDGPESRAHATVRGIDTARVFRAAMRHSRRVRTLRLAIPIVIAAGLLTVMVASWFNPLRALHGLPADVARLVISGSRVTMAAPRLSGFTPDARAYEFVARSAAQDLLKPEMVELVDIRARVEMPDRAMFMMSARNGLFDSKRDLLTLSNDIVLTTPAYEGLLREAVIDIRDASVVSEKPIEVRMLQGRLTANRFEVTRSGEVVRFSNGVSIELEGEAFRGDGKTR